LLSVLLGGAALYGLALQSPAAPIKNDVVADGHHLAVWEKRAASPNTIIILIHGRTWSSLPNFDLQVPGESRSLMDSLAGAGMDVLALDLRGYGATPRDASGYLTPSRAVADITAVVEWARQRPGGQRTPIYVFGLSRGAMLAAMAAQAHPETIAGVILLGFGFDPDAKTPRVDAPPTAPRTPNTEDAAASDFITKDAYTAATLAAFVRVALRDDPVLAEWSNEYQFNGFAPGRMQVPALLVHGDRDPQSPQATEVKLFTRFGTPDKWWVILPGADHAAHLEKSSGELVRTIVAFVHRHDIGRP
jgi:alpha-beta hydrolase superfamily lysophospholipase